MKKINREALIEFILTSYWHDMLVAVPSEEEGQYLFYLQDCGQYLFSSVYVGTWSALWDNEIYSDSLLDAVFNDKRYFGCGGPDVALAIVMDIGKPAYGTWDHEFEEV